ncbi:MAG: hypothetical protein ACP5NV_06915 [Candidatus Woesearchaeota archaeon]
MMENKEIQSNQEKLNIFSLLSISSAAIFLFLLISVLQSLGLAFSKPSGIFARVNSPLIIFIPILFMILGLFFGIKAIKSTTESISRFLAIAGIIIIVFPFVLMILLVFLGTGGFGLL